MDERTKENVCGLALSYVSGECDETQAKVFERHLGDCSVCRAETEELYEAWEVLSGDMEKLDPPKAWKQEVLTAIFDAEEAHPPAREPISPRDASAKGGRWLLAGAAAAAAVAIGALAFWNVELRNERASWPMPLEHALSASASRIETLVPLRAVASESATYADARPDAYGVACIVDNGQSKQFVVYVFGAPRTEGDEAYQVWLVRNGVRTSAGTFRVGDDGIGVLAMPIASEPPRFDSIGITIEPDDTGDQPRGERAFAS